MDSVFCLSQKEEIAFFAHKYCDRLHTLDILFQTPLILHAPTQLLMLCR